MIPYLVPFGSDYVHHSASVLRLLALACVFRGVITLFEAIARVRGNGTAILLAESAPRRSRNSRTPRQPPRLLIRQLVARHQT